MLEASDLVVRYGAVQALDGVSIQVGAGEIVAIVGSNGVGKTTLLRCLAGVLQPVSGVIRLGGDDVTSLRSHQRIKRGVVLVPEGRRLFPDLRRRVTQLAGTLSGGQQQMVAVGRGLMGRPSCLLLDEPSLGLAPLVIRQIFRTLTELRERLGLSIVLVEQDAQAALAIADRGYVMQRARVVLSGKGSDLRNDPVTREIYFGSQKSAGG